MDDRDEEKTYPEEAAKADEGQDQKPVQSEDDEDRSIFDTDEHSDAPGPFGTGEE